MALQKYNFVSLYVQTHTDIFLFLFYDECMYVCLCVCVKETDRKIDGAEYGMQGSVGIGLRIFNLC